MHRYTHHGLALFSALVLYPRFYPLLLSAFVTLPCVCEETLNCCFVLVSFFFFSSPALGFPSPYTLTCFSRMQQDQHLGESTLFSVTPWTHTSAPRKLEEYLVVLVFLRILLLNFPQRPADPFYSMRSRQGDSTRRSRAFRDFLVIIFWLRLSPRAIRFFFPFSSRTPVH